MYELQDKTELAEFFGVDPVFGLSNEKVKENAEKYGSNTFARSKPESLLKRIWVSVTEPMILLLVFAALIALFVNIAAAFTGGETDILKLVGIFAAISLSVIITVAMEGKSAKAFEALNKINEDIVVKALRSGSAVLLNQRDIVTGDVLLLSCGDKIPADGRLLESTELAADESSLTGESIPSKKDAEKIITDEKTPLAERHNMLYSGTFITSGFCKLLVTAVGSNTEFGKIAGALGGAQKTTTPLQERLGRMGKLIAFIGLIAAVVLFASQLISFAKTDELTFKNIMDAFLMSIVLIVAAVPEGLPTIVAVSLSLNIIKLSKQNALVKKIIASETVGCINVICSDKTGTLTENKMTVNGEINNGIVLKNICVNSTAEIGKGGLFIGNPTECALLSAAKKAGWDYNECRKSVSITHVFPFSSEKKNMTTVVQEDNFLTAYSKGSPEKIFLLCGMDNEEIKKIEEQIKVWQEKACRIIAFAHKKIEMKYINSKMNEEEIENKMIFDGFTAISDPLRKDVYDAVNQCRLSGVGIKILTGDNIVTAAAIANELGILGENSIAVETREIEALSDDELSHRLASIAVIARSTPSIKMRIVNILKSQGNVVAVTGDGINDAPALKSADVGIAMGISGTEVSKEAGDIVLLDDSFSTIVNAIRWGRGIYENFKRFICFQLTVNMAAVITVLVSTTILGLKSPLSALHLLWINIIMDGPPALALGLEPIHSDLMKRPPVKRSENIVSSTLLFRIVLSGLYISLISLLQHKFDILGAGEKSSTVIFALFSLFALFNAFNCRELSSTSIVKNFFKNRLMLIITFSTIILQVLIIQFAGAVFGTVPLPLDMWVKIFAAAFSIVVISELVKFFVKLFLRFNLVKLR